MTRIYTLNDIKSHSESDNSDVTNLLKSIARENKNLHYIHHKGDENFHKLTREEQVKKCLETIFEYEKH